MIVDSLIAMALGGMVFMAIVWLCLQFAPRRPLMTEMALERCALREKVLKMRNCENCFYQDDCYECLDDASDDRMHKCLNSDRSEWVWEGER